MAPGFQFPGSDFQPLQPKPKLAFGDIWSSLDASQENAAPSGDSNAAELAASLWHEERVKSRRPVVLKDSGKPPVKQSYSQEDFKLAPKVREVKPDEHLADIAREHLGADANDASIRAHVDAIVKLNALANKDLIKVGQKLLLPGETHDGGTAVLDREGNLRVTWKNGSLRENKIDGSGFYRKPEPGGGYFEFAWGPRPGDAYRLERLPNGQVEIRDSASDTRYENLANGTVSHWRARVLDRAKEKINNEQELSKFQVDAARFEKRAARDNIAPQEVVKMYQQIDRLLSEAGDQLTATRRMRVAEQVMAQAARPTTIDQGDYNSCGITTIEVRTYSLYPSEAAKLVADVALTGKYQGKEGTTVRINTAPIGESLKHPPADGERSHASQLFQVAAVNLHYEKENKKASPRTHLRYEQHRPNTYGSESSGEGVFDYADVVAGKSKVPRFVVNQPDLMDYKLAQISNAITGRNEKGFVLKHQGEGEDRDGLVASFDSSQEMRKKLADLHSDNLLPASLRVDAENDPFYTDSNFGRAGGSGGWHQVTVLRYLPETSEVFVEVDNTWGTKSDHERFKRLTVDQLYAATRKAGTEHTINVLDQLYQQRKARGEFNIILDMDLARQKRIGDKTANIDYVKQLDALVSEYMKTHNLADFQKPDDQLTDEQTALKTKIKQLTLPRFVGSDNGEPRLRAQRLRYQFGIESIGDYESAVHATAVEIAKHDRTKLDAAQQQIWDSANAELENALRLLPLDRRSKLEEKIRKDTGGGGGP